MLREWWRNRKSSRSSGGRLACRRRNSFSGLERLEDRLVPNAGTLDPTFGAGGIVQQAAFLYHASDVNSTGYHSVGIQADGKIVVAGAANGAPAGVFTVSLTLTISARSIATFGATSW